ncbi:unnamed protein product, partial [Staurois parvus]
WGLRAIGDHGTPVSLPKLKKAYEKEWHLKTITTQLQCKVQLNECIRMNVAMSMINMALYQGRTDNSWGLRAIGDHGAPVSLPKLKKAYEKGTRGISLGPLLTPGPRTVPEFPNGQSSPAL